MDTEEKDITPEPRNDGRILAGLFLLFVGAVYFLKEMSFPFFPDWLISWPMILIVIGLYIGIRHQFRNPGWVILMIIGGVFLVDRMDLGMDLHHFIGPAIIIGIGLVLVLRPKRRRNWHGTEWADWHREKIISQAKRFESKGFSKTFNVDPSSDEFLEISAIFGSAQRIIISKNFKGADITCFMGGVELDFTQADLTQTAVIDMTIGFGGGKIIVPADWQVSNQISPVFGGVEDKRRQTGNSNSQKMLILKGTCFFGGFEIKNY
jgi:predicted membrane protein